MALEEAEEVEVEDQAEKKGGEAKMGTNKGY